MKSPYNSLRDYVREYISEGIYAGTLRPGDKISEQSIASRLDVSRTPAREALMQLEAEGLLEYAPRRGFTIKQVSDKDIQDNFEVMALLDAYAACSALNYLTSEDIMMMNECIEKIDIAIKYHNSEDYRVLQHRFHELYRNRCDNKVIVRILDTLDSGLVPEVYVSEDTEKLFALYGVINDEHRQIVKLFEEKNSDDLFTYLRDVHWAPSREGLR